MRQRGDNHTTIKRARIGVFPVAARFAPMPKEQREDRGRQLAQRLAVGGSPTTIKRGLTHRAGALLVNPEDRLSARHSKRIRPIASRYYPSLTGDVEATGAAARSHKLGAGGEAASSGSPSHCMVALHVEDGF